MELHEPNFMELLMRLAQGNPGAAMFLSELMKLHNQPRGLSILARIISYGDQPRGTDLYVLWADLCDYDMDRVEQLLLNCPKDVLLDACSRQDYSGVKLVAPYLTTADQQDDSDG